MAIPSITYTPSNGQTADVDQINTNFADCINGYTDTTGDLSFSTLTLASTATLTAQTASRGMWTNASKELQSNGIDNALLVFGTGSDSTMSHDGTNLILNPLASGGSTGDFIINNNAASVDTRVKGADSTHLLFIDASADQIDIGKNSQGDIATFGTTINFKKDTTFGSSSNLSITDGLLTAQEQTAGVTLANGVGDSMLISNTQNSGQGSYGGAIGFTGLASATNRAKIGSIQTGADVDQVGLFFSVHPSTTSSADQEVALQIGHDKKSTFSQTVICIAATTAIEPFNIPHGVAPTSPTNGTLWTTTAGLYVRINGSTVGPLTA